MEKSEKVTLLSIIILVGFALGVFYHYILGFYLHAPEPYNSFLYPSSMAFCDIFGILPYIKDFAPYSHLVLWVAYFPLTYLIMFPFTLIKNPVVLYLIYIPGFLAYLMFMNIKTFTCKSLTKLQNFQNVFILTALSYPVLYVLDKGNFDMYLFVIFGLCVYAFKFEKYFISCVLLAIVNAMKPFTILFLILFLRKKRYKEFFLSLILTTLLVIGGFMIFKGAFFDQIIDFIKVQVLFKLTYATNASLGIGFSSSMFMPLKAIALHFSTSHAFIVNFVKLYSYICLAITGLTILFLWREKILWKQLTLIICNFLLLPYCTYDYKFIFLFIPIWLFINEEKSDFDLAYILLFGLLLIPKSIIIHFLSIASTGTNWLSLSAILNPIIMVVISLLIIYEQFYSNKKLIKAKKGL